VRIGLLLSARRISVRGAALCVLALILFEGRPAPAEVLPFGLKIEKVFDHAGDAGDLSQSPTGEIWLLEKQTGTIRVFDKGIEVGALTLPIRTTCNSGLLDVAFPPDHRETRAALISWVGSGGKVRVDEVFLLPSGLERGAIVLDLGQTSGCRPGGGLLFGPDGKLYVGVGDLDNPASGQDDASLSGKVLRVEADGSIPADNPDPASAIFAKGFRDPADLALLSRNGGTSAVDIVLYATDLGGDRGGVDEINAVVPGGNHGWAVVAGGAGGVFDDPLVSIQPMVQPDALVAVDGDALGVDHRDTLIHTSFGTDGLTQLVLQGESLDLLEESRAFYDPEGDLDGSPDPGCPRGLDALMQGRDGLLYATSPTDNPGVWRVWEDLPGAREVSRPGSPFPVTVDKDGSDLRVVWEQLSTLDAGRPALHGGQHAEIYTVWEGTLPIQGSYDHTPLQRTNGAPDGPARIATIVQPTAGSRYYLVSAQGDNLEGTTGVASNDTPRDAVQQDYCGALGYGKFTTDCIDDFRHPTTGDPIKLTDFNPSSPTYMQELSIRDFRGKVVHLDLAVRNCFFCVLEAPTYDAVDMEFRGRDFVQLTVFTENLSGPFPFDPPNCAPAIAAWADEHGEKNPILCDSDLNNDGIGDISDAFAHLGIDEEPCGGMPQHLFIDPGGVMFAFQCAFTPGPEVADFIRPATNPETFE